MKVVALRRRPAGGGVEPPDGKPFVGFQPAVSSEALKKTHEQVRRRRIHLRTGRNLDGLAGTINPIVAGWINYYGRFYRSKLYPLLQRINTYLMRWAGKKYRPDRISFTRAKQAAARHLSDDAAFSPLRT